MTPRNSTSAPAWIRPSGTDPDRLPGNQPPIKDGISTWDLSHSFELPHDMSLDLGATFAYYKSDNDNMVEYNDNNLATGDRYSGFHDGLLSVGLAIPFYKYFTVTPSISWAFPLSGSASNEMAAMSLDGRSNHLFGGVTLSMAF